MTELDLLLADLAVAAADCPACERLDRVGGPVRDRLLGRVPSGGEDVDLVVVGDGPSLGRLLQQRRGGELRVHPRFRTVTWKDPALGLSLDLATARREHYPSPGALPEVSPATLQEDLARRDFTVNAMAEAVWPPPAGVVTDLHGGRADLQAGVLRILHPASFVDDPTRMLRLARFAVRFGFEPSEETRRALEAALDPAGGGSGLDTVSPDRVAAEWARSCSEPEPAALLAWLAAWGLAAPLGLAAAGARGAERLAAGRALCTSEGRSWDPVLALGLALVGQDCGPTRRALGLRGAPGDRLERLASVEDRLGSSLAAAGSLDALERLLRSCSEAERTVLRVGSPEPAAAVQRYELQALGLSPLLGGHELVAAGMVEGPALGAALSRVRSAQLQGEIASRQEALALLGLEPSEEP